MILLMGVAGAGKSVQGKLLADKLGYRWLSTGEFLRMHISGKRRQEMLEGKLLADEEIIAILDKLLDEMGNDECILDGFPRTLAQAQWLLDQYQKGRLQLSAVVHLSLDPAIAQARLLERARPDDNPPAIEKRFSEYESVTKPSLELFSSASIPTYHINGDQSVEAVHNDIIKALSS